MEKTDFVKEDKDLYLPKTQPQIVQIPKMKFLMFDGTGAPEDNHDFQKAFQALYGLAYSIKFFLKSRNHQYPPTDYRIPPPEGLWWTKAGKPFSGAGSDEWCWTLMVRVPEFVNEEMLEELAQKLVEKKQDDVYMHVRLGTLSEGKSIQVMHLGPYEKVAESISKLEGLAQIEGYKFSGFHHEIYLSDPRRVPPEKMRTVLRHPVRKARIKVEVLTNSV